MRKQVKNLMVMRNWSPQAYTELTQKVEISNLSGNHIKANKIPFIS